MAETMGMVTCLDCGTSITGPDGEGMTSNEVVILELVRPVASAIMTTPGRTFCVNTERNVDRRKRISSSTVITAVMPVSTSCLCVYGREDMASANAS